MTDQPQQPQQDLPPQAPPGYQAPNPERYGAGPHPMSPQDEKTWATLVHLAPFVAAFVGIPFLGPLIVFLLLKDRGPFVRFHAAQALNFQIIITIALWVFGLLSFVLIGIPFFIATCIAWVALSIVAAVKANQGEWYRYPLTPELVK
ncbi:DUF4870 domain-containing protein [Pedococcus bigeumensis]|nr:DUF4870 domain-containing protein [Pedococcus bigeumensis]